MNRVWIELERPSSEEGHEIADHRAALANAMLRKLGVEHDVFFWVADKHCYAKSFAHNAGFVYLTDNGDWFNLDYLSACTSVE